MLFLIVYQKETTCCVLALQAGDSDRFFLQSISNIDTDKEDMAHWVCSLHWSHLETGWKSSSPWIWSWACCLPSPTMQLILSLDLKSKLCSVSVSQLFSEKWYAISTLEHTIWQMKCSFTQKQNKTGLQGLKKGFTTNLFVFSDSSLTTLFSFVSSQSWFRRTSLIFS